MPPEAAFLPRRLNGLAAGVPQVWRMPLLRLALAWAGLFAFFARDWADMVAQWWDSSTYNHILFVPAIVVWLVAVRARGLARFTPSAWRPGLVLIAGAMLLWVLGAVSELNIARQLGAVAAMQGAVATILGPRVCAGLLFPLGYMLFLVPFGDELIPALQLITAKLAIALTHWSGVPAVVDGVFINTPAGLFEVAEECSGVKFLIAMIALAALVAHVCFRSRFRRVLFMAAAIALPILANGVRAWGTIYIAQFRGIEFAAGFDHIFYGWIFFGLVMAALLGFSWRFFDRAVDDPMIDAEALQTSRRTALAERWRMNGWTALAGMVVLAALAGAWAARAESLAAPMPASIALPAVPGWDRVEYAPAIWWEPRAGGADHRLLGRYRNRQGQEVDVFFALYSSQREGKEAGAFGEGALMPDTDWRWLKPGPHVAGGRADLLFAQGRVHRLAETFYRTGDLLTGGNGPLKFATMRDRMLMRARPTMMLILSAEDRPGYPAADGIAAFRRAAGPMSRWMDGIAQLP